MKKRICALIVIALVALFFGCRKDALKPDTLMVFTITLQGTPVSGCRVDAYSNSSDWSAGTNRLAYATSGTDGTVTFTKCSAQVYYCDFIYEDKLYYSCQTTTLVAEKKNTFNITLVNRQLTFNNATLTTMRITVDGTSQQSIPAGESVTYSVYGASSVHYVAETNQFFSDGVTQLGLKLTWDNSASTPDPTNSCTLNASTNVCYFRITNNSGASTLGDIYFNYGNSYQTVVSTNVPANGIRYNFGYHYAIYGGQIRAYYTPYNGYYSYWNPSYPSTVNQYLNLTNSYKSSPDFDPEIRKALSNSGNFQLQPEIPITKKYIENSNTQQIESNGIK